MLQYRIAVLTSFFRVSQQYHLCAMSDITANQIRHGYAMLTQYMSFSDELCPVETV